MKRVPKNRSARLIAAFAHSITLCDNDGDRWEAIIGAMMATGCPKWLVEELRNAGSLDNVGSIIKREYAFRGGEIWSFVNRQKEAE